MANKFRKKIEEKILKPIIGFLKQGMTPTKLALSISLGFCFGLFPIVGITTLLCLIIAFVFKLNLAAIQLINYLVYPFQLVVLIPLIHLGSNMLGVNPIPYSIQEVMDLISEDWLKAVEMLWMATLMGMFAWLVTIVPASFIGYFILRSIFLKMAGKPSDD
ncbi:DUF2062 domain-containing protein [Fulvivirga lutea]|uniref:DUF2062 domain-containing protein n=1 Tax=Fulvivirga lutea TaxID=2810512 RepID=A0A974WFJ4_9BACT|nr:DUF2062 domain-containing protein [Fulvivirga lutea]QSE96092.1 DUF2062 domain-containing protein [Fulvivirga lutea]